MCFLSLLRRKGRSDRPPVFRDRQDSSGSQLTREADQTHLRYGRPGGKLGAQQKLVGRSASRRIRKAKFRKERFACRRTE